ncbi:6-bladed beta-propeller [Echinicola sp. CAU 1574]|uniref:6-bladed beta-propeller n=1 Tax=Echinicola arenosa TaxID=2774144 RepID=A0ABR9ANE6_9BACT|nr:6-bladed beta-propeller [Echinicola arenosa]MBD8489831.1 6-bladed beta-propeller [Echinicola arenosa]
MKSTFFTASIFILFFCLSCKKPTQSDENIISISLSEKKEIPMSEIISKIEYIVLPDNFNFSFVDEILFTGEYYFFCDFGHTYKIAILDKNFNLKGTIENYGEGPGEYQYITDACINSSKKSLDILSNHKLLRFDFKGDFIEEFKVPYIISKLEHLQNDDYIIHIHPWVKSITAKNNESLSNYLLYQWNTNTNDLTPILPNPYEGQIPFMSESNILKKVNKDYFFTKSFTDSIYWIRGDQVVQKYHLEFRNKLIPMKLLQENDMVELLNNPNTRERYIYHFARLFASEDYMIDSYQENGNGTLIYNRHTGKSISSTQFKNDIDHGLSYLSPRFLQDNIIFNIFSPESLMEHDKKHQEQLSQVNNAFTKMAKKLNRDSGSILVKYHLK